MGSLCCSYRAPWSWWTIYSSQNVLWSFFPYKSHWITALLNSEEHYLELVIEVNGVFWNSLKLLGILCSDSNSSFTGIDLFLSFTKEVIALLLRMTKQFMKWPLTIQVWQRQEIILSHQFDNNAALHFLGLINVYNKLCTQNNDEEIYNSIIIHLPLCLSGITPFRIFNKYEFRLYSLLCVHG